MSTEPVHYEWMNPNSREEFSALKGFKISEEDFQRILINRLKFYWRIGVVSEEGTLWFHRAHLLCQDRPKENRVIVAKMICTCRTAQRKLLLFGHDIQRVNCKYCERDFKRNKI